MKDVSSVGTWVGDSCCIWGGDGAFGGGPLLLFAVVGKPSSFFTVLFLLLLLGSSGASLELSEDEIIGLILLSAAFGDDCSVTGGLVVASISFNDGMVHVGCYQRESGLWKN